MSDSVSKIKALLRSLGAVYDPPLECAADLAQFLVDEKGFTPVHADFIVNITPTITSEVRMIEYGLLKIYNFGTAASITKQLGRRYPRKVHAFADHFCSITLILRSNWTTNDLEFSSIDAFDDREPVVWEPGFQTHLEKLSTGDSSGLEILRSALSCGMFEDHLTDWNDLIKSRSSSKDNCIQ